MAIAFPPIHMPPDVGGEMQQKDSMHIHIHTFYLFNMRMGEPFRSASHSKFNSHPVCVFVCDRTGLSGINGCKFRRCAHKNRRASKKAHCKFEPHVIAFEMCVCASRSSEIRFFVRMPFCRTHSSRSIWLFICAQAPTVAQCTVYSVHSGKSKNVHLFFQIT